MTSNDANSASEQTSTAAEKVVAESEPQEALGMLPRGRSVRLLKEDLGISTLALVPPFSTAQES